MSFVSDIEALQTILSQYIRLTPTVSAPYISREIGAEIHLKLELLQFTGAFKVRGAISKMLSLTPQQLKGGVVAFSAGNHGLGVAFAAKLFNTNAKIFVPATIPELKKNALIFWGAELIVGGADLTVLKETAVECAKQEGRVLFHPWDDPEVIKGQATLGVEMLQAVPDLEAVVVSVGGGGLISGVAEYLKSKNPKIEIYGVETIGCDSMTASLKAGKIVALEKITSIAESIGVRRVSPITFEKTKKFASEVVTVTDQQAVESLDKLIDYAHVFCEPSASCTLAAIEGPLREKIKGKKTLLLLCGGNFSISQLEAYKNR